MTAIAPLPDPVRDLEARLRSELGERVSGAPGERALYASDASNYRRIPRLVAHPASADELAAVVGHAAAAGVPITMRGAGTSIAGNALGPGLLVVTRRMDRILAIDPDTARATVEPGVVLGELNRRLAPHGLRVGPDPSTHARCTIGGMLGNNACGAHSVAWGTTAGSTLALDVIRADGERIRLVSPAAAATGPAIAPDAAWPAPPPALLAALHGLVAPHADAIRAHLPDWPRRVSGYALDRLLPEHGADLARAFVGSEGTWGVVAAATLALVRPPVVRVLLVVGFPDDLEGADAVPALLAEAPYTIESMSTELLALSGVDHAGAGLPAGGAWLMIEAGGASATEARDHAQRLASAIGRRLDETGVRFLEDPRAQAALWRIREDGAGYAARLPDGGPAWPGFEDSAVPPARLAAYLRELRALLRDHGLEGITYGHYGEGCIHLRVGFGLDRVGGAERYERFLHAAAALVGRHGGSISGEHGDGLARSALLGAMYPPEILRLFEQVKDAWDPAGVLNPGIIVRPPPVTTDLRAVRPLTLATPPALAYAHDGGSLRAGVERCIGVGRCVSTQGQALMCPSFRATGDERHSTRGRARLLQELLTGELAADGWRSTEVREALDLCLACKGCVSDCPTQVDMASYKSEFLHHHYRRRLRPRAHYSLGWLPYLLRVGERMPRLVNALTGSRATRGLVAFLGGIEQERGIPPLARTTFRRAHRRRAASAAPAAPAPHGPVVLWPDTFTDHLSPEVGHAGVRVLEAAGYAVSVPARPVCCGLTWMTTGQLDTARRVLRATLAAPELAGDAPVVVLEPSCAAMLRTDLPELLPDDPRARSVAARVRTLAELLDAVGFVADPGAPPAPPALSQPHCHHQAVLGLAADRRVRERNGIAVGTELAGCCGLAGSFGAERGHGEVARKVADLALTPALAAADPSTPVLADGFSCRTQIASLSGRRALHLAEVLAARLPDAPGGPGGSAPPTV
ncbi:MAG: FAD-binding and (Fe-S)-binding domain-containing protein [Chloroflexota bacterium]